MADLRIGLTQRVEVSSSHGERRDCLDQAWTRLLCELDFTPVPLANCIKDVEQYVRHLQLDGVILTGGNDLVTTPGGTNLAPERDHFEDLLIKVCEQLRLPVFGVCRGLQMLVVRSGGQLSPVENHVACLHNSIGCVNSPPSYFGMTDRDAVNSFHNFGIKLDDLGKELDAIATAPDGTVEAVAHQTLRQAAVMWHPERAPKDPRDAQMIRCFFEETSS